MFFSRVSCKQSFSTQTAKNSEFIRNDEVKTNEEQKRISLKLISPDFSEPFVSKNLISNSLSAGETKREVKTEAKTEERKLSCPNSILDSVLVKDFPIVEYHHLFFTSAIQWEWGQAFIKERTLFKATIACSSFYISQNSKKETKFFIDLKCQESAEEVGLILERNGYLRSLDFRVCSRPTIEISTYKLLQHMQNLACIPIRISIADYVKVRKKDPSFLKELPPMPDSTQSISRSSHLNHLLTPSATVSTLASAGRTGLFSEGLSGDFFPFEGHPGIEVRDSKLALGGVDRIHVEILMRSTPLSF